MTCVWHMQVLLITNDMANLKLAKVEGLAAMTMQEFVKSIGDEFPDVCDRVAVAVESSASPAAGDVKLEGPAQLYPPHMPMSKIQEGLRTGAIKSGAIRLNRDCWFEGTVGVQSADGEFLSVSVSGREAINRATEVRERVPHLAVRGRSCMSRFCYCDKTACARKAGAAVYESLK